MTDEKITVIAYSGYRNDESPRAFILYEEEITVKKTISKWIEEDLAGKSRKRYFTVKGSDGYIYKMYYNEKKEKWFLVV
jgi:hypothetical protein